MSDPRIDTSSHTSGVRSVPRNTTVRVARVDRRVLFWTVLVAAAVVGLSFVSIVVHGLVLQGAVY